MTPLSYVTLPLAAGFLYNQYANRRDAKAHPCKGKLVDIGDSKLHVCSRGKAKKGAATVIVETGIWDCHKSWQLVQSKIAKKTRIITYDRAGYGFSEPSKCQRTFDLMACELKSLLEKINAKPPFILVGHSMGDPIIRYFQSQYPHDVAGMIFVDAAHKEIPSLGNSKAFRVAAKAFSFLSHFGALRLMTKLSPSITANPNWTPNMQKIYNACHRSKTSAFDTCIKEWNGCKESFEMLNKNARSLSGIPVTVISRDPEKPMRPGLSDKEVKKEKEEQIKLNNSHLAETPHAKLVIAEGSGHLVQLDKPEIVIAEILQMLKAIGKKS